MIGTRYKKQRKRRAAGVLAALLIVAAATGQQDLAAWPTDPFAALAALPIAAAGAGGHLVTVRTDAAAPVAAADVWVVDLDRIDEATRAFLRLHWHRLEVAVLASRFGVHYRTAANGTVVVAMPEHGACFAMREHDTGTSLRTGDATIVTLDRCGIVNVEVVDADGRPVEGLPLSVRNSPVRTGPAFGAGVTDRTGRARLVTALQWVRGVDGARVRAAIVADEPVFVPLPSDYFDAEHTSPLLQLRLPPTGSALVTFGGLGEMPGFRPKSTLAVDADAGPFAGHDTEIEWPVRCDERGDFYPAVAVGTALCASVQLADSNTGWLRLRGVGPVEAGEQATLALALDGGTVAVAGRLLDADGTPAREARVRLTFQSPHRLTGQDLTTAADGRFTSAIDLAPFGGGDVRLEVVRVPVSAGPEHPAAIATLSADARGVLDLGELRIAPQCALLGGRVVDDTGAPVAGVDLTLSGSSPEVERVPLIGLSTRTDAAGRFVFRRDRPICTMFGIHVGGLEWRSTTVVSAAPGQLDLVIEVARVGSFALTLAQPDDAGLLRAELVPTDRDRAAALGDSKGGRIRFARVAPGRYDLVLKLLTRELTRIPGVEVPENGGPADPRLVDLDWHAFVQLADVTVRAPGGQARVRVVDGAAAGPIQCRHGRLTTVPYLAGMRLFAGSPQGRSVEIVPAGIPIDVELQPRAELCLREPEGLALPSGVFAAIAPPGGGRDILERRQPGEDWIVRPDAHGSARLEFVMRDDDGRFRRLFFQDVDLPVGSERIDVVLELDEAIVELAEEITVAVRKKRG
ncbi:MAG: carboxypeptidase regulatory-like domain-containing protein [Planctomycetes bacterium]|nr:carboxypeptidase regulatory-like domain-containing protein [Planctomycetota bacterium]